MTPYIALGLFVMVGISVIISTICRLKSGKWRERDDENYRDLIR